MLSNIPEIKARLWRLANKGNDGTSAKEIDPSEVSPAVSGERSGKWLKSG